MPITTDMTVVFSFQEITASVCHSVLPHIEETKMNLGTIGLKKNIFVGTEDLLKIGTVSLTL